MKNKIFEHLMAQIDNLNESQIKNLLAKIKKQLGASEHFMWCVKWEIEKFKQNSLTPYEVFATKENITLDGGIEMLWKLVAGKTDPDVTPFSETEAKIFVGSSSTAENATQSGVLTPLGSTGMNPTYPQVSGRSIIFEGTFGADTANGDWREASVTNGSGANYKALNRKTDNMGTKAQGTSWTIRVTISALTE